MLVFQNSFIPVAGSSVFSCTFLLTNHLSHSQFHIILNIYFFKSAKNASRSQSSSLRERRNEIENCYAWILIKMYKVLWYFCTIIIMVNCTQTNLIYKCNKRAKERKVETNECAIHSEMFMEFSLRKYPISIWAWGDNRTCFHSN